MIETILSLIPGWLVLLILFLAGVHRLSVAFRYGWTNISPWENIIVALSLLNGAAFYFGLEMNWIAGSSAIIFSRFVFIWIGAWSLYISHRMVKRVKPTKNEKNK